jgi:mRNA-degrading endonuclease RelE of RelBE toxin-antitoxin system
VADSTNTLVRNPHRVGKPLRFELAGIWAARRGTYRVLYRVNDTTREVIVLQSNTAGTRIAR